MISTTKDPNLSELAYRQLKDLIIKEEIARGEVLSIVNLSKALNIGRTPISNACQRLECEGLLRVIPKQGVLILDYSIDDARDLYESRCAVELYAARHVFKRLTPHHIEKYQSFIDEQMVVAAKGDNHAFMELDTEMHLITLRLLENKLLTDFFNRLMDKIFYFGLKNSTVNQRIHRAINEHQLMLNHLKEGNEESYLRAIEQNIMNGYISFTGSHDYMQL